MRGELALGCPEGSDVRLPILCLEAGRSLSVRVLLRARVGITREQDVFASGHEVGREGTAVSLAADGARVSSRNIVCSGPHGRIRRLDEVLVVKLHVGRAKELQVVILLLCAEVSVSVQVLVSARLDLVGHVLLAHDMPLFLHLLIVLCLL